MDFLHAGDKDNRQESRIQCNPEEKTTPIEPEKLNINVPRRTSVKALRKKSQEMITSGQISVGEKIVSIEYKIMRIDPDGKMVMKINHVGRPTMVNLLKK